MKMERSYSNVWVYCYRPEVCLKEAMPGIPGPVVETQDRGSSEPDSLQVASLLIPLRRGSLAMAVRQVLQGFREEEFHRGQGFVRSYPETPINTPHISSINSLHDV
jgi:hypothetical protein